MIDTEYLARLMPLLILNKVIRFKAAGLELEFKDEALSPSIHLAQDQPAPLTKEPDKLIEIPDSQLPLDLKSDSLHDYDKVLNWSSPDAGQETLPGVGETLAAP